MPLLRQTFRLCCCIARLELRALKRNSIAAAVKAEIRVAQSCDKRAKQLPASNEIWRRLLLRCDEYFECRRALNARRRSVLSLNLVVIVTSGRDRGREPALSQVTMISGKVPGGKTQAMSVCGRCENRAGPIRDFTQ